MSYRQNHATLNFVWVHSFRVVEGNKIGELKFHFKGQRKHYHDGLPNPVEYTVNIDMWSSQGVKMLEEFRNALDRQIAAAQAQRDHFN